MRSGLPAEIFIQVPSNFICLICKEISHPLVITECGHPFCEPCITQWITQTKNECPTCRLQNPKPKKPEPFVERWYNSTQVKCLHFSKGCTYQGELKDMLESHITNECEFEMIPCTNKGCDTKIERRELQSHLEECKFRSIKCRYCEKVYLFKDEENHFNVCKNYTIECDHCDKKIKGDTLDQHIAICPEVEVQCNIVGCTKKVKRKDLQNHENEEFINHLCLMNKYLMEENKKLKNEMKDLKEMNDSLLNKISKQENENEKKSKLISSLEFRIEQLEKAIEQIKCEREYEKTRFAQIQEKVNSQMSSFIGGYGGMSRINNDSKREFITLSNGDVREVFTGYTSGGNKRYI